MFAQFQRTILSVLLFVLVGILCPLAIGQDQDVNRILRDLVKKIEIEEVEPIREDKAANLLKYVVRLQVPAITAIDDHTIDEISKLLRDPSDIVKSYAADSLGYFGTRARRALPTLRNALDDAKRNDPPIILPSRNSISAIELAIRFIDRQSVEDPH